MSDRLREAIGTLSTFHALVGPAVSLEWPLYRSIMLQESGIDAPAFDALARLGYWTDTGCGKHWAPREHHGEIRL